MKKNPLDGQRRKEIKKMKTNKITRKMVTMTIAAIVGSTMIANAAPSVHDSIKTCMMHEWELGDIIERPTCTEEGKIAIHCHKCGCNETGTLPALGHHWADGAVIEKPTCTKEGLEEVRCTECGCNETASLPMTEHNFSEPERTKEYSRDGSMWRLVDRSTCEDCGFTEAKVVLVHTHKFKTFADGKKICVCGDTN